MRKLLLYIATMILAITSSTASAAVAVTAANGWFESGYVTWTKAEGLTYNVYVQSATETTWTKLDTELVREYPTYGRADAVGLKAGQYRFKVVPVQDGTEITADATETEAFTAAPHDRGGFAHFKTASSTFNPSDGVGAYKNDGTLKDNAKVIYVTAGNAKTITTTVKTGSKDTNITECTGFQAIIDAYQKGYDTTPIAFRLIGTLRAADMDSFSSSAEGLQIKGKNAYSELNITIEGIGNDATIHGFGFLLRNACSVELRNFAIMWFMDDAVSMDTDNSNLWIHNLDLFYGKPGSDSDQKKGDGTLDIKGDSKYSTLSYNHLWDSGKASLCGMTSETGPNYITYHHNWFDHSDSRHPRIRTMSVHVYNNYYDGNSKYGIGATTGSDVFAENNFFRNCKYPMLISKQGSDINNGVGSSDDTKGTFSGEDGGIIKAYGNVMSGQKSFEPYVEGHATYGTHFDAYVAASKDEKVPATVTALLGGDTYSNFDTDPSLMYSNYTIDNANDVPGIVQGNLGAGRCQHGDFSWTFDSSEDSNDAVIEALSAAINAYTPTLIGIYGGTTTGGDTPEEPDPEPGTDPDPEEPSEPGDADAATMYSFSVSGPVQAAEVDGVAQNYSDPIATTGGTFTYGNVAKIEASQHSSTGYGMKLDGNASATSTKYALINLNAPLKAGDKITLTCYATSTPTAGKPYGISIYGDPAGAALASVNSTLKNTEEALTITVPAALEGATSFYLFRNVGYSVYFTGVTVKRSATAADGIKAAAKGDSDAVYDLSGRKVTNIAKGQLYIKSGKTFIAQ